MAILAVIFVVRCTVVNVETTEYDPADLRIPPVSAFPPASQSSLEVIFQQQKEQLEPHDTLIPNQENYDNNNNNNNNMAVDDDSLANIPQKNPPSELEREAWTQEII